MEIDKKTLKSRAFLFLGIYFLFVISISISIGYTEHIYFHRYILDSYVAEKVFFESLKYSVILFITASAFNQLLSFLSIYKSKTQIGNDGNAFIIKNNIFLNILIFLVSSVIALPIKTVITAFYEDRNSTFFRLAFVHFSSEVKIISAIIIFLIFALYIIRKYKFATKSLVLLMTVLILPACYFIWSTRSQNFEALAVKIQSISGESLFFGGHLTNKSTGEKIMPYAEKLLRMASNEEQKSTAYFWLARGELDLNNGNKALDYINKSITLSPSSGDYMAKSAIERSLQNFTGSRESAQKCLEIAIKDNNLIGQARCESEIGLSYLDEGVYKYDSLNKEYFVNAKLHIEKAIMLDPEQSFYKIGLNEVILSEVVSDFHLKNYNEALTKVNAFLSNIDSFKPKTMISRAYGAKGDLEGFVGDYKSALIDLKKALEYSTEDIKAIYTDIGLVYEHLNDNKSAVLYYDKALNSDPEDVDTPSNSDVIGNKKRAQEKL